MLYVQPISQETLAEMRRSEYDVVADNVLCFFESPNKMMVELFPKYGNAVVATHEKEVPVSVFIGRAPDQPDAARRLRAVLNSDTDGVWGLHQQLKAATSLEPYVHTWEDLHSEPFANMKKSARLLIEVRGDWDDHMGEEIDGVYIAKDGRGGTVFARSAQIAIELGPTDDTARLLNRIYDGKFRTNDGAESNDTGALWKEVATPVVDRLTDLRNSRLDSNFVPLRGVVQTASPLAL